MLHYFNSREGDSSFKRLVAIGSVVVLVLLALFIFFFYRNYSTKKVPVPKQDFRTSLEQSVGGQDPKPLQDFFVNKVKSGVNDDETKSAIYWITHRYFDNGGNIYEIYDFVNSHPEISFLKEAELTYPTVFTTIKTTKVPNYSAKSVLALLAYYEVIDRHGYASIAVWGIAANKYSEFAYGAKQSYLKNPKRTYSENEVGPLKFKAQMVERSMFFMKKADDFLSEKTQKTGTLADLNSLNIIPDDLLVGLNQYGSAIENLKSVGMIGQHPYEPAKIYDFNYNFALTKVPRLYFFTNYLYATSLVYGGDATKENVKVPLSRAVEYAEKTERSQWRKSVLRVINSKTGNESSIYNYDVAKKLAALDDGFRNWLKKNGWTDADFK